MKLLTELKPGDRVKIDDEGIQKEGTVVRVSAEEQEVCIDNSIQEFWYNLDHVRGIPITPERLLHLGFEKMDADRGVKYGKGPFRVWAPSEDFCTKR